MTKGPAKPVTAADLAAALPALLAAPRDAGVAHLLCTGPEPNARRFPDRLIVTRTAGVVGDFAMSRPWLRRPDGSPDPAASTSMLSSTAFRHLKSGQPRFRKVSSTSCMKGREWLPTRCTCRA